ncbi:MAG: type II toxin-antitoxin system HicA family toxin [Deltaproteobacteria bacterium]|nr:type II toxin-antitoxin system HicA family toxin [Deltaproteobacteria bacterium]
MTNYPSLSFHDLIKKVMKLGFKKVRQKGSHIRFVHSDGRKTTIPDHGNKDVPHGLLMKIIRYDLEMDTKDFFDSVPPGRTRRPGPNL